MSINLSQNHKGCTKLNSAFALQCKAKKIIYIILIIKNPKKQNKTKETPKAQTGKGSVASKLSDAHTGGEGREGEIDLKCPFSCRIANDEEDGLRSLPVYESQRTAKAAYN